MSWLSLPIVVFARSRYLSVILALGVFLALGGGREADVPEHG